MRRPFPQHIPYAAGTILPNHRSQAELDDDVRTYYEAWKARYLVSAGMSDAGRPLYRISAGVTTPACTVSEGQGYGMMIVAWMAGHDPDARRLFDGLWQFVLQHPSGIDPRLMSFEVPFDPRNFNSAFDGDADIAYALLLADAQWLSRGEVNYQAEARKVIAGITESTIGKRSRLPLLGDWARDKTDSEHFNQYSVRTSDFMPDHFRAFRKATGDETWAEVLGTVQRTITDLQTRFSPGTGLLPDFIEPRSESDHAPQPATPFFLESQYDGAYYYNAGRLPWRLGAAALLDSDSISNEQARKISRWAHDSTGGNPTQIHAGYALDGTPLPDSFFFSIFFSAPLGVAAMTDPENQAWLNEIFDAVHTRHDDSYEDSVTMLSLLLMSGNAWTPDPTKVSARRRGVRR